MKNTTGSVFTITIASALTLLLVGCTKQESIESLPGTHSVGYPKIPNVFVRVQDGITGFADYPLTLRCGPDLPANGDGRLMFEPSGCNTSGLIQIDKQCIRRNAYYWLMPPVDGCNICLKFSFDSTFDYSQLTSALVRFEPATCTWEVPNSIPGFNWAVWDTRLRPLPRCQVQNVATS